MEYVDGDPLLRYCAERRLGLEARIRLLVDICAAVQFAHRALIVHLDLKSTNVLVTADGSVKLLDFGIANYPSPKRMRRRRATCCRSHSRPPTRPPNNCAAKP